MGRPGGTTTLDAQAACCGPPAGRRPARAARRAARTQPNPPLKVHPALSCVSSAHLVCCSPPAMDCAAQKAARATPFSVGFSLSPIPPRRYAPGRQGRRPKGSQEQKPIHSPILWHSSSARLPRAANASLRPRTAVPFRIALFALRPKAFFNPPQFFGIRAARSGGGPNGPARRPGGSTNRKSTDNSSAQPTAPCSAQRGAKTDYGFRARRTNTT